MNGRDESLFPMGSFPTWKKKRKKNIIRTVYPENIDEPMPKRAMIDLDKTIHKYSKGYADGEIYDKPFEGARTVLNWLKKHGYSIAIFTTRASEENANELEYDLDEEILKIEDWLKKHNIPFDLITGEKLAADFYIDDKAIHIPNGDWNVVLNVIKKRIKYKVAEATQEEINNDC